MSSKTDKRAKEILRLLLNHGKTSVEELTELFATSPASVRRDLVRLEERGLVEALPSTDRRRPYQLTSAGRRLLREQLARMEARVATGRQRLAAS